jgi:hypothetical protein
VRGADGPRSYRRRARRGTAIDRSAAATPPLQYVHSVFSCLTHASPKLIRVAGVGRLRRHLTLCATCLTWAFGAPDLKSAGLAHPRVLSDARSPVTAPFASCGPPTTTAHGVRLLPIRTLQMFTNTANFGAVSHLSALAAGLSVRACHHLVPFKVADCSMPDMTPTSPRALSPTVCARAADHFSKRFGSQSGAFTETASSADRTSLATVWTGSQL